MEMNNILRNGMIKAGMNQRELSIKTDIPEATISRYLSGQRMPKISKLKRIMKVIDITEELIVYLLAD